MRHAPNLAVVDSGGRQIQLGKEIGRGGEGAVFEVATDGGQVAKIYHSVLHSERADKIRLMASLRTDQMSKLMAWPIDLLLKKSGEPIGLLMPKISGRKDIHRLYSPKSRRADFQRADWRFLIRAASNTARAFAAAHEAGCVIGDVNHGSILVAQDATVRLIDCDSFQFVNNGRRYLCEVGVETFTPPELQGKPFKGILRTQNHDNFGLAVMLFLILFMGRHPFAGRFLGPGEMPIPKAIEQHRFAYGLRRSHQQMERPPGAPALSIVGDELAHLFETAFSVQGTTANRPTPKHWFAALDKLEPNLKQCAGSPSHWFLKTLGSCPWCPMEAATGVFLFPMLIQAGTTTTFDIQGLWRQVEALQHPGPAPPIPEVAVVACHEARSLKLRFSARNWIATAVAAVPIGLALSGSVPDLAVYLFFGGIAAFFITKNAMTPTADTLRFRRASDDAASKWRAAQAEWMRRAGSDEFDRRKAAILSAKQEWNELPNERLRRLDKLKQEQRTRQLETFLDQFEIDRAKIEGIGPGRKQTLESYGIETAADVVHYRITNVPGFGPKRARVLLAWRQALESRFRFDPKKAIDPQDIAKVEQEILTERARIETRVRSGLAELTQLLHQIKSARQHMRPQVEAVMRAYSQALADYNAVRSLH